MAIYIDSKNRIKNIFINVNGQKKKVTSAWVNRSGVSTKVFSNNKTNLDVTWANGTDEQIASMLDAHYAGEINIYDYWHIGDERIISLSAMESWNTTYGEAQPAQSAHLVIIGFNFDTLREPVNGVSKAAITVQLKKCLKNTGVIDADYITYNSNYKSCTLEWVACDRRTWCNNTFKNSLPEKLRNLVKIVKKTNYSVHFYGSSISGEFTKGDDNFQNPSSVYDSCFLLSSSEAGLTNINNFNDPSYPYFTDNASRFKGGRWWVRNPGYSTAVSTHLSWSDIVFRGQNGGQFISNKGGIAPAFCL